MAAELSLEDMMSGHKIRLLEERLLSQQQLRRATLKAQLEEEGNGSTSPTPPAAPTDARNIPYEEARQSLHLRLTGDRLGALRVSEAHMLPLCV